MKTRSFYWVDAFSDQAFRGNPCPVFFDCADLNETQFLQIAREMNQSETAFVLHTKEDGFRLRIFTPSREIPLAGHPTLASVGAYLHQKENSANTRFENLIAKSGLQSKSFSLSIELNDGPINVKVENESEKCWVGLQLRKPEFFELHDPREVAPLFGLSAKDLADNLVPQTVSTGTRQLMIPVKDTQVLDRIQFQAHAYVEWSDARKIFSPHLFAWAQDDQKNGQWKSWARHPNRPPGPVEDAFTGSATGSLAAYLWHHRQIDQPNLIAYQGHHLGREGMARVQMEVDEQRNISQVSVFGQYKILGRGEFIF